MAETLKERGWFWWADRKLAKDELAPDDYVSGTLTIEADGQIELELDGELPGAKNAFLGLSDPSPAPSRSIAGLLKSANKYIIACDVHRSNRHWSGSGITYDTFSAQLCLVSSQKLPSTPKARALQVSLEGYEDWLRFRAPRREITSRSILLRYKVTPDLRYRAATGSLLISHNVVLHVKGLSGQVART